MASVLAGLVLTGVLAASAPAAAQHVDTDEPFDLTADSVEYDRKRDLYVARGNVRITHPNRSLTADWMTFNNTTRRGVAVGNVVVVDGGDTLFADSVQFDVDTFEGLVLDGRLDARDSELQMTGKEVRRIGEDRYTFEDGTFTSCRCPEESRQPWQIRAQRADLEVGGYGTARNTTFEILGVPVLWLPWMIYPLKTERQTGLLFPEINSSSRSGGDFGLPLFWAARDDLNVTYTPSWLAKRGFMHKLEVEHVFGERGRSDLFLSYIRDTDTDEDDPSTPFDRNRWGIDWAHDQDLPWDWRLKVDARLFSDNLYSFDFKEFSDYQNDRFLESRVFVERHFGEHDRISVHGGVWFADDQQNPDDLDRDRFLLQRAPNVALSTPQLPVHPLLDGLLAAVDVDYAHFWSRQRAEEALRGMVAVDDQFIDTGIDGIPTAEERNGMGLFDGADNNGDDFPLGPEGDGRFQEGEPLADRGHRLRVNPRLSYPVRLADLVEVTPELGYHGTFYHTREKSDDARHLITGQLDVRTRLRRVLELPFSDTPTLHLVEPRIAYTGVSSVSQSNNPLFSPAGSVLQDRIRQLELYNITRDPSDRIDSLNALTVGVGNRLYADTEDDGVARLLADLSLSTQYDLSEDEFGSALIDGTVYPGGGFSSRFNFGYDLGEQRVSEGLFRLGWSHEAGHDLSVHYRFLRDIPPFFEAFRFDDERFDEFEDNFTRVNQVSLYSRVAITRNWAVTYNGAYSFEQNLSLSNRFGLEYLSKCRCWAVRLEAEDNRSRGFDFNLSYRLIGLGDDTVRPFQSGGSRLRRDTTRLE